MKSIVKNVDLRDVTDRIVIEFGRTEDGRPVYVLQLNDGEFTKLSASASVVTGVDRAADTLKGQVIEVINGR